jgi:hypothetical protein
MARGAYEADVVAVEKDHVLMDLLDAVRCVLTDDAKVQVFGVKLHEGASA